MNELRHYGVLGMKWGVRRYQNPDGSLTPAGKKRVSKEYKKVVNKATKKLSTNKTNMYVRSYNKAADYMNGGGIDKFNSDQRKKYGENYVDRDEYVSDYKKEFDKILTKNMNKTLNEFYSNDASVKKARDMVKKYDMVKWDDFAKNNEAAIEEVRKVVEEYND